jgi:hypothetical protein
MPAAELSLSNYQKAALAPCASPLGILWHTIWPTRQTGYGKKQNWRGDHSQNHSAKHSRPPFVCKHCMPDSHITFFFLWAAGSECGPISGKHDLGKSVFSNQSDSISWSRNHSDCLEVHVADPRANSAKEPQGD